MRSIDKNISGATLAWLGLIPVSLAAVIRNVPALGVSDLRAALEGPAAA